MFSASNGDSPALSAAIWFTLHLEPRSSLDWSAVDGGRAGVGVLLRRYLLLVLVSALCVALIAVLALIVWRLHCRRRRLQAHVERENRGADKAKPVNGEAPTAVNKIKLYQSCNQNLFIEEGKRKPRGQANCTNISMYIV